MYKFKRLTSGLRFLILIGLVIFISGFYETNQEIIRAFEAVAVYNLPETYQQFF